MVHNLTVDNSFDSLMVEIALCCFTVGTPDIKLSVGIAYTKNVVQSWQVGSWYTNAYGRFIAPAADGLARLGAVAHRDGEKALWGTGRDVRSMWLRIEQNARSTVVPCACVYVSISACE